MGLDDRDTDIVRCSQFLYGTFRDRCVRMCVPAGGGCFTFPPSPPLPWHGSASEYFFPPSHLPDVTRTSILRPSRSLSCAFPRVFGAAFRPSEGKRKPVAKRSLPETHASRIV